MSVRYEGSDAAYTTVDVLPAGAEIGEDVVREGHVAVVFEYDEVFYIEGTPERLRRILRGALARIDLVAPEEEDATSESVRHYDAGAMG